MRYIVEHVHDPQIGWLSRIIDVEDSTRTILISGLGHELLAEKRAAELNAESERSKAQRLKTY